MEFCAIAECQLHPQQVGGDHPRNTHSDALTALTVLTSDESGVGAIPALAFVLTVALAPESSRVEVFRLQR